jgi:uncharacterized membrane protein
VDTRKKALATDSTLRRDAVGYGVGGLVLGVLFGILIAPIAGLACGVVFAAAGVGSRHLQRRLN